MTEKKEVQLKSDEARVLADALVATHTHVEQLRELMVKLTAVVDELNAKVALLAGEEPPPGISTLVN